jgi:hypothetical protein
MSANVRQRAPGRISGGYSCLQPMLFDPFSTVQERPPSHGVRLPSWRRQPAAPSNPAIPAPGWAIRGIAAPIAVKVRRRASLSQQAHVGAFPVLKSAVNY